MRSILIVEDDPAFAVAVEARLDRAGFEVEIAPNTRAALARVDARRYDILLVDLATPSAMPSGLSLARMVRWRQPRACVIFVTGHPELADALPRFSGKVFTKPVELDDIVAEIRLQLAQ